jgi:hypothetical protein
MLILVSAAIILMSIAIVGAVKLLTDAMVNLTTATAMLALALDRSAEQTRESVQTARAQLEMNKLLVDAVRRNPPASRAH